MSLPPQSRQQSASPASLWVKVCGMTTVEGVAAAVAAGVDAVGFVFFPRSKRYVTPQDAARLAARVPKAILKVAVFLHPSQAELDAVLGAFQPDIVQTDLEDFARLTVPAGMTVLPVLRSGGVLPTQLPPRVLFEGPTSGTGTTADWTSALTLARRCEVILAGGLTPANVADAVRLVAPFGVDVSSGVEQSPGIKDPERIAEFVRSARQQRRGPGAEQ
jgi:phosphoribosylanthranilate isomerase